jgi:hypothetical protein
MEKIRDKINLKFQKYISKDKHPFFTDIRKVDRLANNFLNYQKNYIMYKLKYNNINVENLPSSIDINEEYNEELTKNDLIEINNLMKKNSNYFNIFKIVTRISRLFIKNNDVNINKEKKTILIIGAGPIGLFTACYLKTIYEDQINIIIYDSRIIKPGFRKPYTRVRPFSTSSKYLSLVIPKLYCMTNQDYIFINIFLLEYILYSQAVLNFKIPIYYNDYDWNDYKKIIKENNVKVVFDCTGGRLKTDVFENIDSSWLKNKIDKKINKQLLVLEDKNLVHLIDYPEEKKFKKNHFYGSLNVYTKDMLFVEKFDIDIMSEKDLIYLNKIKKKYYTHESIVSVISGIKDNIGRDFLYTLLREKYNDDYYFMIDVWGLYIRHIIKPANIFDKDKLYVTLGDSMFHSHFITGAGLNRTIKFAVYSSNLLEFVL